MQLQQKQSQGVRYFHYREIFAVISKQPDTHTITTHRLTHAQTRTYSRNINDTDIYLWLIVLAFIDLTTSAIHPEQPRALLSY